MSDCTKCEWLHHHDGCHCCSCRDDEIDQLKAEAVAFRGIPEKLTFTQAEELREEGGEWLRQ